VKDLALMALDFPPSRGGIQTLTWEIYSRLNDRLCVAVAPACAGPDPAAGWPIHRTRRDSGQGWNTIGFLREAAAELARHRAQPLLLHCNHLFGGYAGSWLRWRHGVRYVVWAHGEELTKHRHPSAMRIALGRAEAVFANSAFTADVVGRICGRSRPEVHEIPLGADAKYLATPAPAKAGEGILTVARLSRRDRYKGVDVALQALALLAKQGLHPAYRVVGDGDDRGYLEQLTARLGLNGQVSFTGAVAAEQLVDLYDQCAVFLLCSREQTSDRGLGFEGFGIVYLEANARGKPVIGGRAGGVPSAVLDGETGILVDPTSPASVAEALARLLGDPKLRARLGTQGRVRVEKRYNWDQSAAEVRDIHARICKRLW